MNYKVCRGYFDSIALRYCHKERGLPCAGKTKLVKRGTIYYCPDCGWTSPYNLDGEPRCIKIKTITEEWEALNRAMVIKMNKKSEIARVLGTD